jgi:hypothetical protein
VNLDRAANRGPFIPRISAGAFWDIFRESGHSMFLHLQKWTTPTWQMWRSIVHAFVEKCQIMVVSSFVERTQFDMHRVRACKHNGTVMSSLARRGVKCSVGISKGPYSDKADSCVANIKQY